MDRPDWGYYGWMGLFGAGAVAVTLAASWLTEHVAEGFSFLIFLGSIQVLGAGAMLVGRALKDGWSWWRTRPPEFVSSRPAFFRLFEPVAVVVAGALAIAMNVLTSFGWLAILIGFGWFLVGLERHHKLKKAIRSQIESAGVKEK
jgi:hypothetical protein